MTQADVLAQVPPSEQKNYAGQSIVAITRVDGDKTKPIRQQNYVSNLCYAINDFFSCKWYSTSRLQSLDVTFYGIADNTAAAAVAFEMVYNLIAEWARPHKGASSKNSYCHGVCDELYRDARRERAEEEKRAKEAETEAVTATDREKEARVANQQARLQPSPSPPASSNTSHSPQPHSEVESDVIDPTGDGTGEDPDVELEDDMMQPNFEIKEEDEPLDTLADIDLEIDNLVKTERKPSESLFAGVYDNPPDANTKKETTRSSEGTATTGLSDSTALDTTWSSHTELILFRETASKIADDWLEERNMKISNRKLRPTTIRDHTAYLKGKEDSSKIDVRRKRLTGVDG